MIVNYRGKDLDIQPGDVILFKTSWRPFVLVTYLSFFVRLFTSFRFNHAGTVIIGYANTLQIIEAKSHVINPLLTKALDRKKQKIAILRPQFLFFPNILSFNALKYTGVTYDSMSILHQAVNRISIFFCRLLRQEFNIHLKPLWIGKTGEESKRLVNCTELAAILANLKEPWLWSAKEFYKSPAFKVIYDETLE